MLPTIYHLLQGLFTNYFPVSSWLWCIMIIYHLHQIVVHKKVFKSFLTIKLICWLVPLVPTLFPLITDSYGPPNIPDWCFIVPRENPIWSDSTIFWVIVAFYGWFFVTVICMVYLAAIIILHIRAIGTDSLAAKSVYKSLYKLAPHPAIIIACWTGQAYMDIMDASYPDQNNYSEHTSTISDCFASFPGFLLSVYFFISIRRARELIILLFHRVFLSHAQEQVKSLTESTTSVITVSKSTACSPRELGTISISSVNPITKDSVGIT